MRFGRPGAWQRVVALAPLLLVLVSLPSQVLIRCQMDGLLREACCCPRGDGDRAAPAGPAVASASCCKSETAVSQLPAVRTTAAPDATPTLISVVVPAIGPGLGHVTRFV